MRFRSEQHLRRQRDIRAVRELGRRLECRAFTLWWRRRDGSVPSVEPGSAKTAPVATRRVCVIASTASVGGAVRRNRAKRRLREVFRHHQTEVPADCDLLLIARTGALDWPLATLEQKFTEACRQIPPAPSA
jgi:ribonuclease P protein component